MLKGGVLLAALGKRRPTRDIDLQTRAVGNDPAAILATVTEILSGYGLIGQQRWDAWRRKQRLDDRLPSQFTDAVTTFADPAIIGTASSQRWNPATGTWSSPTSA